MEAAPAWLWRWEVVSEEDFYDPAYQMVVERASEFITDPQIGDFIEEQYTTERPGRLEDFHLPLKPSDVEDALVMKNVVQQEGQWMVYLVFVDMEQPCCFFRQPISRCRTRKLAEIVGSYKRRRHSADPGLAFQSDIDEMGCCWN